MANSRPLTYTTRICVRLTPAQYEAFRQYALHNDTAVAIVLREAALEAIGRSDLSLAEETEFTIGEMLRRKDRPPTRRGNKEHRRRSVVNLTDAQRVALELAAAARKVATSGLIRDAGLARIGAAPAAKPDGARGRPPGTLNRVA